jgi:hypothetical protein
MLSAVRSEGEFVAQFIEAHCRLTKGTLAGQLVKLLDWQKDLIVELFRLEADGSRRYRRAYIQVARKNGKTFLMACVALYEALFGEIGGRSTSLPATGCRRREPSPRSAGSSRRTRSSAGCSRSTSTPPRSPRRGRSCACSRPTPASSSGSSPRSRCSTRSQSSRTTASGTRCPSDRAPGHSR